MGTLKNYIIILINASSKPWCFIPPAFFARSDRLQPRFRDKDLEERREEFMRTLIKNPSKVLIILERSKGEKSIPEMDKVLDTFKIRVQEKFFLRSAPIG